MRFNVMSSDMSFSPLTYPWCGNWLITHVLVLLVLQINSFNSLETSLWGPNEIKWTKESMFHVIDTYIWEFMTSMSQKNWNFVTYLSWKMGISWLICHEKWGFCDFPVTKQNSSSHETVRFRDIPVTNEILW